MKTIITPLALVGLLAVPLIASLPQDQGATGQPPPNEGEYDWRERWPGRRVSQVDQRKLTRGLQGLWRLSEIDVPGRFAPTQAEKGYLLVSGNHMSMEIHGDWYTEDSYDPSVRGESTRRITGGLTQTGIHTFEINEWGRLVTRTLIGTKSTFDGTYEFEPPRTERTYEIDVSGSKAILRGDDGRSLIFRRMREVRKRVDLFGRPIEDEIIEGLSEEPVKRDIYGRPIEDPEPELPPLDDPQDG